MEGILGAVLNSPTIGRIRRNHALEHATVHILSSRQKDMRIYARSGPRGVVVYGDVPTEMVTSAASEALERLRNGEHELAVHPNCGTNLVTAGGLASLSAVAALGLQRVGNKKRSFWQLLGSLPLVVLASTLALIIAQPLGQTLQLHLTTEGDMGDLRITGVTRQGRGRLVHHTIGTAG